jgi:hypothetical protein
VCCISNCITHLFLLSSFPPDSYVKMRYSRKAETKKDNCVIGKVRKTKIDVDNIVYRCVCVYIYIYSDEVCADDEYFNPEGLNIATLL